MTDAASVRTMDRVPSSTSMNDLAGMLSGMLGENGTRISASELLHLVGRTGLSLDDARIARDVAALRAMDPSTMLTLRDVLNLVKRNQLLETALSGGLVCRNFDSVSDQLDACYHTTLKARDQDSHSARGEVSRKSPKLARVPASKVAASFCSIHGQTWDRGEYDERFTVQEAGAPLLYCLALQQHGEPRVHELVGREPMPEASHMQLDSQNRPFNPFTQAGEIICNALVCKGEGTLADRFNFVKRLWADATGSRRVGFANSHYLSQRSKGNRAYWLGYMLNEERAYPNEELDQEAINETINLHFMTSNIEVSCRDMACFAALLAGGGVCPISNERVFEPEHVRSCLCMMGSCGMGTYSGAFQFTIGFPCKSSSSGFTLTVIPNLGGICTFSPRLDSHGNSVFGLRFLDSLMDRFPLHTFSTFAVQDSEEYNELLAIAADGRPADQTEPGIPTRRTQSRTSRKADQDLIELFYAAAEGNTRRLRCLHARNVDVSMPDYDMRTPLHLAASNGHLDCVKLLCFLRASPAAVDRFGNTPLDDARLEGHTEVAEWLSGSSPSRLVALAVASGIQSSQSDAAIHMSPTLSFCIGAPTIPPLELHPPSDTDEEEEGNGEGPYHHDDHKRVDGDGDGVKKEEGDLDLHGDEDEDGKDDDGSNKREDSTDEDTAPELNDSDRDEEDNSADSSGTSGSTAEGLSPASSSGVQSHGKRMAKRQLSRESCNSSEQEDTVPEMITVLPKNVKCPPPTRSLGGSMIMGDDEPPTMDSEDDSRDNASAGADSAPSRREMHDHLLALNMLKDIRSSAASNLGTGSENGEDLESESGYSEGGPPISLLISTDLLRQAPSTEPEELEAARRCARSLMQLNADNEGKESLLEATEQDLVAALEAMGVRVDGSPLERMLRGDDNDDSASDVSLAESLSTRMNGRNLPRHEPLTPGRLLKMNARFPFVRRVLEGRAVINDFTSFKTRITEIFESSLSNTNGDVARYIPQLAAVNPEQFGVGICSVDAQRFVHGDARVPFCVQSCMKPINYGIAQELIGQDLVHKHVGFEPSGLNFNELTLNADGLPHNPVINSGAIMTSSLILPESSSEDRFDFVTSMWTKLTGGVRPGYSNETFLSEYATADRNCCLGYLMKEKHAFPPHVNSATALKEVLEFYFSCCSLELDCDSLSVVAATLANGGVNPVTQKRVFSEQTVRNILCIMASSGMYDFSGEFQYTIGVPAKSGVSGVLLVVVPNVMGVCVWSPRLDRLGNSARGIEFCLRLSSRYSIHRYSQLRGVSKCGGDLREWCEAFDAQRRVHRLIEAATRGDTKALQLLLSEGNLCVDAHDYDGRTALHLAASEGHLRFVRKLHAAGAGLSPTDRWGGTPLSDATRLGHAAVADYLRSQGAAEGSLRRTAVSPLH